MYAVSPGYNGYGTFRTNILDLGPNLFEADLESLASKQECCRLLLEAGADPTDNSEFHAHDENGENGYSPFFDVFTSGNVVSAMTTMC